MTLRASDLLSAVTYRGFGGPESGFRWSGAHGEIVFPDPGPGWPVRVEVLLSGWRPRGQPRAAGDPDARAGTASASVRRREARRSSVDTVTSGAWRSDLVVVDRLRDVPPGAGRSADPRRPRDRGPPARRCPPASAPPPWARWSPAAAAVLLLFLTLVAPGPRRAPRSGRGSPPRWRSPAAMPLRGPGRPPPRSPCCSLVAAAAVAVARPAAAGPCRGAPRAPRSLRRAAGGRAAAPGLAGGGCCARRERWPWWRRTGRSRGSISSSGSGGEVAVARGFGAYDAVPGVRYRRAPRGAELDLGDLGGGTQWTIAVTASHEGRARQVDLLRAGTDGLDRRSSTPTQWTRLSFAAPAPFGWRSGLALTVPGGSDALRIARVEIDRGRAWPSLRIGAAVLGAGLLAIVGLGAAGAVGGRGPRRRRAGHRRMRAGDRVARRWSAIPFALPFLAIVAVGALLAAAQSAVGLRPRRARASPSCPPRRRARRRRAAGWPGWPRPRSRSTAAATSSSTPRSRRRSGRAASSSITCPIPGSMLSEQAQWGNVVVPHPALYQTLAAPLAALPRPWFFLAEKAILALLFASMAIVASLLADRAAGRRAAAFTAVVTASLVPTFQLLGLGHLMTILGVWSSSVALAWLALRADRLSRTGPWWITVALLTFCFLSYTAALLFTAMVLAALIASAARRDPVPRPVAGHRDRRRLRARLRPLLRALDVALPQPVGAEAPRRLGPRSDAGPQAPRPPAREARLQLRLAARARSPGCSGWPCCAPRGSAASSGPGRGSSSW